MGTAVALGLSPSFQSVASSFILDSLSVAAKAAYSLRKIKNAYAGNAVRVRRSNDNAEQDIGFIGGNLDTTSLMSFVGYENQFLYSEQFDNAAWTKAGVILPVVTGDQVQNPFGSGLNADKIDFPAVSSGFSILFQSKLSGSGLIASTQYTFSVYLRGNVGGEKVNVMWTPDGSTYTTTLCTLTTSWQRYSVTFTSSSGTGNNYLQIGVDLRDSTQTATSASTVYAWGTQLNQGAAPQSYQQTTSAAWASANGFVTTWYDQANLYQNLLLQSQQMDSSNTYWFRNVGGFNNESILAPDSSATVVSIFSASQACDIYQGVTLNVGTTCVFSCYLKKSSYSAIELHVYQDGYTTRASFNFDTATATNIIGSGATMTAVGDGWYRCSIQGVGISATVKRVGFLNSGGAYVWGAQLNTNSLRAYTATTTTIKDVNDLAQATAALQPKIVNNGVLVTDGALPALLFTGTEYLTKSSPNINYTKHYVGVVATPTVVGNSTDMVGTGGTFTNNILLMNYNSSASTRGHYWASSATAVVDYTPAPTVNTAYIFAQMGTGSVFSVIRNGTPFGTTASYSGSTAAPASLILGGRSGGGFQGYMKGVTVFSTDLTLSDRNLLERNQGTYYGISVA